MANAEELAKQIPGGDGESGPGRGNGRSTSPKLGAGGGPGCSCEQARGKEVEARLDSFPTTLEWAVEEEKAPETSLPHHHPFYPYIMLILPH